LDGKLNGDHRQVLTDSVLAGGITGVRCFVSR
jgi:hypothetical protein